MFKIIIHLVVAKCHATAHARSNNSAANEGQIPQLLLDSRNFVTGGVLTLPWCYDQGFIPCSF